MVGSRDQPLTLDHLPPANGARWVASRKAAVVAAVASGLLTVGEACERYLLSVEEFTGWQRAIDRSGVRALRITQTKQNREAFEQQGY